MKTPFLAVTLLALSASFASAEVNSLSGKAMSDLPGTKGGFTANPLARVYSGDLSDESLKLRPELNVGSAGIKAPQPEDSSLAGKAMRDLLGRS